MNIISSTISNFFPSGVLHFCAFILFYYKFEWEFAEADFGWPIMGWNEETPDYDGYTETTGWVDERSKIKKKNDEKNPDFFEESFQCEKNIKYYSHNETTNTIINFSIQKQIDLLYFSL